MAFSEVMEGTCDRVSIPHWKCRGRLGQQMALLFERPYNYQGGGELFARTPMIVWELQKLVYIFSMGSQLRQKEN